jgi:hypothetical protein
MAWLWRWVFVVGVPLALLVVLIGSWIERRSGKLYIVNVLPAPVAVSLDGRSISLGTAGQSGPVETAIGTHLLEVRSKEGVLLESEAVVVQGSPIITIYSVAGAAPIASARGGTGWCGQRILEVNNPKGLLQNAGAGAQARVVTAGGGLGTCVEWAENKGSPGLVMSLLLTAQRFSSLEAALPGVKSDDAWVFVFEACWRRLRPSRPARPAKRSRPQMSASAPSSTWSPSAAVSSSAPGRSFKPGPRPPITALPMWSATLRCCRETSGWRCSSGPARRDRTTSSASRWRGSTPIPPSRRRPSLA